MSTRHVRALLPLLLSLAAAAPAAAQLHAADSLAVIRMVQRYHALLEAGDTVALQGVVSRAAVIMFRGDVVPLSGEGLAVSIRWDRAIGRDSIRMTAKVRGNGAYVYMVSRMAARAAPIQGTEIESVFLSRIGSAWMIELVHRTVGEPD